ncbi:unnamed protein product [Rotaria sordida]|uniref:Uncharacterized protein n=1 Tax=Rotaria sordida TaxID=392033 RepID=A0A813UW00_9BILA|nr:unnamed protein product [Rotaria sordida]
MRRRQTTRRTSTTNDNEDIVNPIDEIWKKIESIEQEVNQRFEEIDHGLNCLKEKTRGNECHYDERFLKLCHAVDYLLERIDHDYDTLAFQTIDIDLRYIEQVREKIPFIQHRRHDLYTLMSPTTIIVPIDDKNEEKIDILVSPFRCVERFSQLNPEQINDLFQSTQLIGRKIEEYYQAKSLTISYTRSTRCWTNC